VNNLPKVVTQLCPEWDLNPRPVDLKSNDTSRHLSIIIIILKHTYIYVVRNFTDATNRFIKV